VITAVVTFKLPPEMTREKWREHKSVSPRFQKIPGLIRKQFLYDDNGNGGGMYLWENREAAEACYSGPWKMRLPQSPSASHTSLGSRRP
jgi:hypothetical protein